MRTKLSLDCGKIIVEEILFCCRSMTDEIKHGKNFEFQAGILVFKGSDDAVQFCPYCGQKNEIHTLTIGE